MTDQHSIPVIDISAFRSTTASKDQWLEVVRAVKTSCRQYGFLQVTGHGVPVELQRAVFRACEKFFALPEADKEDVAITQSNAGRGYEKLGQQQLDAKSQPDQKEGFSLGRDEPGQTAFLRGPNQWPNLPQENFRQPISEYLGHMERLGNDILRLIAAGLGYNAAVLEDLIKEPNMYLKLLHYPPQPSSDKNCIGAGQHTDFGGITILMQQPNHPALQVYYKPTDEWIPVPATEDVLVINMGDMMHQWTYGQYSSVLHRVINNGGKDRYSVPCFYQGDLSAFNPFKPNEVGAVSVGEHIRMRMEESYKVSIKA